MIDKKLVFSDAQSIVANATTVNSENDIDLGALTDDRGVALKQFGPESGKINLVVSVADQPTAGTGIAVALHDCATDGGTFKPTGIGVAAAIPNATLVVGYTMLNVALKPDVMRVLRIVYTTTGNHTGSAGKINAGLVFGAMSEDVTPYRA